MSPSTHSTRILAVTLCITSPIQRAVFVSASLLLTLLALPQGRADEPKTPSPSADQPAQLLDKVQTFYAGASDFLADFKQTYTYHIYGRKKVSTGRVFFKKPSKMRWDYEAPIKRVFVADGSTLWVYEPEESQVFKRDLSSAQLPVALRFMKGEGKLSEDFIVTQVNPGADEGYSVLHLKPRVPSPDFVSLQLTVNRESGAVSSSMLTDPTQNTNRIDFVDVKVNQSLPDAGFSFTPPAGVRVIDEATASPR